jgi:hypothetical protein
MRKTKKAMYEALREGIRQLPASEVTKLETLPDPAIMTDSDDVPTVVSFSRVAPLFGLQMYTSNNVPVIYWGSAITPEYEKRPYICQISRNEIQIVRGEKERKRLSPEQKQAVADTKWSKFWQRHAELPEETRKKIAAGLRRNLDTMDILRAIRNGESVSDKDMETARSLSKAERRHEVQKFFCTSPKTVTKFVKALEDALRLA